MRRLASLASVVLLTVGLAACSSSGNSPGDRVDKAIKQANVKNVNVDYDKNANVVHLKGNVDSTYDRAKAEQVATDVVGTSGKVVNELTVNGVDNKTADDMDSQIKTRLNDRVKADPELSNETVDFNVNNGVVTVTGRVKTAEEKAKVEQMVKGTTGVKDVANELDVQQMGKTGTRHNERRRSGQR